MDTIEVAINHQGASMLLLQNLGLGGVRCEYKSKSGFQKSQRRGFKYGGGFVYQGKPLFIAWEPYFENLPQMILECHLSKFPTYTEFVNWITSLLGIYVDKIWSAKIIRIDLCIDLSVSYETIVKCLFQRSVTSQEKWSSSTGKTLCLGKAPRRTIAYTKKIPLSYVDLTFQENIPVDSDGNVTVTRIEVSLKKAKKPIKSLSEVGKLFDYRPFDHLMCKAVNEIEFHTLSKATKKHLYAFMYRVETEGMQKARREFSESRNFHKTIAPYLQPVNLNLQTAWENRLKRYFCADQFYEGSYV